MKTIYKITIIALASMLLLNCQKEEGAVMESSSNLVFEVEGGTDNIVFEAKSAWELTVESSASSWCTISQNVGTEGHQSVQVNVSRNSASSERHASITLSCGSMNEVINVSQKMYEGKLYRMNLKMTHNASTVYTPLWFGNNVSGSIIWEDGGLQENYVEKISHCYGNTKTKSIFFEMNNVSAFIVEDVENVSHLSIYCE